MNVSQRRHHKEPAVWITAAYCILIIEAGKRSGKPCIREMRITVYDVLSDLATDMTPEEILTDFPDLTENDVRACLNYAADRECHS